MFKKLKGFYYLCSYVLILPLFVFAFFSGLFAMGDVEQYDRQTEATVVACKDVTHRTKGEYENGGPSLMYEVTALYEVDGKPFLTTSTGGSRYRTGSQIVISYNSVNPEENFWGSDPKGQQEGMKTATVISRILTILALLGCILGIRESKKRSKKGGANS